MFQPLSLSRHYVAAGKRSEVSVKKVRVFEARSETEGKLRTLADERHFFRRGDIRAAALFGNFLQLLGESYWGYRGQSPHNP